MAEIKEIEKLLKALANKRRLAIVKYLKKRGEARVGDIAKELKLSFKATSKHLGILRNADILEKEQRSLEMWYKISSALHPIAKYISNSLE
ncbi:MAG: metalloregulator ArsR/SmtB family transcription factor [Nanoarchaeota archaeon]|nr:metalloregulator ArsR/SmtB family transcription factor [Nanoarchaeota archaeon]